MAQDKELGRVRVFLVEQLRVLYWCIAARCCVNVVRNGLCFYIIRGICSPHREGHTEKSWVDRSPASMVGIKGYPALLLTVSIIPYSFFFISLRSLGLRGGLGRDVLD